MELAVAGPVFAISSSIGQSLHRSKIEVNIPSGPIKQSCVYSQHHTIELSAIQGRSHSRLVC
eukprot:COSAG05_NODE_9060_length_650_cov_0.818512_1_plen_61_part_01